MTTTTPDPLANILISILGASHITLPGTIHTGPGPIDIFGTRFANDFTDPVIAKVNDTVVDRQGLENNLLALRAHWNSSTAKFVSQESVGSDDLISTKCTWTQEDSVQIQCFEASAKIVTNGESTKISKLFLHGDASLFKES